MLNEMKIQRNFLYKRISYLLLKNKNCKIFSNKKACTTNLWLLNCMLHI